MLFADFQGSGVEYFLVFLLLAAGFNHFCKKVIGGNDALKSAAKDLATKKAIGFLQRFLK